jgi:hypothetical protein
VSIEICNEVNAELVDNADLFRQYKIQGCNEPRAHFLLHQDATEKFDDLQHGYKYGGITMKARPLSMLPRLQSLACSLERLCNVPYWNIGVNPVYYRDGNDYMGFHADDDQDEKCIMTILTSSPLSPRKILIRQGKRKVGLETGDVEVELYLSAGDGYCMDGTFWF